MTFLLLVAFLKRGSVEDVLVYCYRSEDEVVARSHTPQKRSTPQCQDGTFLTPGLGSRGVGSAVGVPTLRVAQTHHS